MNTHSICCIDDDKGVLKLLARSLSDTYDVHLLGQSEGALELIQEVCPSLILLDVALPGADGYELCARIRRLDRFRLTPVLFVSAGKTLEDRLAGYEAGGDAYICKPFDIRELHAIVASLISRKEISDGHLQDLDSLQALSWTMMKNNCEMGELLKFSRSISSLRNESAFVTQLFKTLSHFNLNVTLLVRLVSGEIVTRSDGKPFTLIEKELLELAREDTRITCHGSKYIFTAQNLVLLVKNMPVQDEDLTGRLKDHLCMLLDAAQTCVELLNFSKHREREGVRQRELILNTIREEFNNMNRLAEQIFEQSNASVEKLAGNLEHAFTFMDLTEDQERHMLDFIAVSRREIDKQEYCKAQFAQSLNRILHAVGGAAQGVALEEPG